MCCATLCQPLYAHNKSEEIQVLSVTLFSVSMQSHKTVKYLLKLRQKPH